MWPPDTHTFLVQTYCDYCLSDFSFVEVQEIRTTAAFKLSPAFCIRGSNFTPNYYSHRHYSLSFSLFQISQSIFCSEISFRMLARKPSPIFDSLWEHTKFAFMSSILEGLCKHSQRHLETELWVTQPFQHISMKPKLEVAQCWRKKNHTCVLMGQNVCFGVVLLDMNAGVCWSCPTAESTGQVSSYPCGMTGYPADVGHF